MKKILTIVLSSILSTASAQWSNTNNLFYDSLHMVVSNPALVQKNPIVLTSYPDGGYFVIWEDERNTATTKTDIYAQKYDQAGIALWGANGIPIANSPNNDHYTFSSTQDYRNRSFAATDSAGGFYITYSSDSVSNYVWEWLLVQHIRSNGTGVFPNSGYRMATSNIANLNFASQLIADGNKGFFIAYKSSQYVYAYDYREENGTMKFYGGGKTNENAIQTSTVAPCGIKTDVIYPGTTVIDYNIWPDGQAGCNIIISMNGNTGSQYNMLCYNRLFRAKKNASVKTFFRNVSGTACQRTTNYVNGDVYLLYYIVRDYQSVACGGSGGPLYTYTNHRLLANGYLLIDQGGYDYNYPKGVTVRTSGNINVDLFAVTTRTFINNTLGNFTVQGFANRSEIFDSVPYQRCTYSNPDFGYNGVAPAGIDRLSFFRDTLLATSNYYPDFSLAGGKNDIFASALMTTSGSRWVRLQHLKVAPKGTDSFAIEYKTNISGISPKEGVAIGRESNVSGGDINYDLPIVQVSKNDVAVFSIREQGRGGRVSPIDFGSRLTWGAMGKPVASGTFNNNYYNFEQPVIALDSTGSSGLIVWKDNRTIPVNTSDNIYMRHLDKLDEFLYSPPAKRVRLLPNPYGPSYANPALLLGSSQSYTLMDVYNTYGADPGVSPVMDIFDNNYLGNVRLSVFQNSTSIRKYNNKAYLNRNYTLKTDSLSPGATINMKLYFTTAEFNALKNADNIIDNPGYLSVIRQPNASASANAPAAYTPVAGEEILAPSLWDSVAGGYTITLEANGTGHFFIQRISANQVCSGAASSFTSNITGVSYQWQSVSDGSNNFVNVINNSNYSGATTQTLQLTNIPTSLNGYRYRCVVNDLSVSNYFYLQIADGWTGAVSNQWENPANWACGIVPDEFTDVVINSGTVTVNSNAKCRSITITPTVSFTVKPGFSLQVMH